MISANYTQIGILAVNARMRLLELKINQHDKTLISQELLNIRDAVYCMREDGSFSQAAQALRDKTKCIMDLRNRGISLGGSEVERFCNIVSRMTKMIDQQRDKISSYPMEIH